MKSLSRALFACTVITLCLLSGISTARADMTDADVEAIVKKVIANNPELLVKSLQSYEAKEQAAKASKAAQNITALQGDLNDNPNSPSVGNPNGDVTVVEFFDYHCGYCKHFYPTVSQLIEQDKKVRVVFKEFPILSADSGVAAKAALAVNSIDPSKYFAFHTALMESTGSFDMSMLTEKAKEVGIDKETFLKAMKNPELSHELDHNKELAQALGIGGTPVIIIGTQFMPGAISYDMLKDKVAIARKSAKDKS